MQYILTALSFWEWVFFITWSWRYVRLIVHTISHWTYKSVPISQSKTRLTNGDATVIIPTIHINFEDLRESLESILACYPYELILVTTSDKYETLQKFAATLSSNAVRVFQSPIANKRLQVCEVLREVKTDITIMADDDVTWPDTILPWLLAPFEDKAIGAVGPSQRVKRLEEGSIDEYIWNFLGAAYIERRNFEISATHHIDGGTSCMSGRTCAFRSDILQDIEFLTGFKNERWGNYILNADDDNFITRWLVSKGWKTWIQYDEGCQIETTLENNPKYLRQCLRWARSNWRSNWTSLVTEGYVWKQQPWSTYALHLTTFSSLAFVMDPFIFYALWEASKTWDPTVATIAIIAHSIWFAFSKVVKLIGLFRRRTSDIMYLPAAIIFGQLHGLIKLFALCTLHVTSWGSREDGDADDNERMAPQPRQSQILTCEVEGEGLIRYRGEKAALESSLSEKRFDTERKITISPRNFPYPPTPAMTPPNEKVEEHVFFLPSIGSR